MKGFGRIVVGIDGSPVGQNALHWAAREAVRRSATLVVVHAWERAANFSIPAAELADTGASILQESLHSVAGHAINLEPHLIEGPPTAVLNRAAQGADLLVVGSHGHRPLTDVVLGSVSLATIRRATCPVVVIPKALVGDPPEDRIVAGVDGSEASDRAVLWATTRSSALHQDLVLVHAWHHAPSYLASSQEIRDCAAQMLDRAAGLAVTAGGHPYRRLIEGPAGLALSEESRGASMLVIGGLSHSRLIGGLLGCTIRDCVRHSFCPVVVIPAQSADLDLDRVTASPIKDRAHA